MRRNMTGGGLNRAIRSTLAFASLLIASTAAMAQTPTSAGAIAEKLRAQLAEAQSRETELQTRLRQLDNDLRPENIEHSLAGVGSTRPEELREQRRRQLEAEKSKVQAQLDEVAASKSRLESAIAAADAEAYRQSANVNTISPPGLKSSTATTAAPGPASGPLRGSTRKRRRMGRASSRRRKRTARSNGAMPGRQL